jgi:serine/threonine-protein kinase
MAAMSADDGAPGELDTLHDVDDDATGGAASAFAVGGFAERYERGEPLGAGGMGVVQAWRDRATGREVAMKTVRAPDAPGAALRFAREARVQAQLEHPSIVPVYDVGIDPDGALYFTMKRVRGHSLQRVLQDGAASGYSLRRLLTVMARVARTLEFAHRRGVVNRDLKPANLMLGEFDEIYVLDWGIAQVRDAAAGAATPAPALSPSHAAALAAAAHASTPRPAVSAGRTLPTVPVGPVAIAARAAGTHLIDSSQRPETGAGQILGTLGYLAPEQLADPERVDHRCDIYALGAILFEVLAGERLHDAQTADGIVVATLELDGASPAERAPDRSVPPELDALVRAATRRDPGARPASAAELAAAIDAYLDGDRDLARRRELAAAAADAAHHALVASRAATGDTEPALRAAAVRDVGRALALDPDNTLARTTLLQALTEPPRIMPPAAEAAYRAGAIQSVSVSARNASLALLSYAAYVPLILWMGVRRPWLLGATIAATIGVTALTYLHYRRPPARLGLPWSHVLVSTLAFAFGMSLFGPLVLLPSLVIITGVAYVATFDRTAIACVIPLAAVIFVPLALQLAGVLPPSYEFAGGTLRVLPGMAELSPLPTLLLLVVAHLIVVIGSITFVWRLRCAHRDVERRLAFHAWQLAQLVPDAQPSPPAPAARRPRATPSPPLSGQGTRRGKRLRSAT